MDDFGNFVIILLCLIVILFVVQSIIDLVHNAYLENKYDQFCYEQGYARSIISHNTEHIFCMKIENGEEIITLVDDLGYEE